MNKFKVQGSEYLIHDEDVNLIKSIGAFCLEHSKGDAPNKGVPVASIVPWLRQKYGLGLYAAVRIVKHVMMGHPLNPIHAERSITADCLGRVYLEVGDGTPIKIRVEGLTPQCAYKLLIKDE